MLGAKGKLQGKATNYGGAKQDWLLKMIYQLLS